MGLSALLTESQKNITSDDQGRWRQFILDHLDYIGRRCTSYDIAPELMNQYRYDLARMLKEHFLRHEDLAWIVLLLNNMHNDFDFHKPGVYLIPSDNLITNLYHNYATINRNSF